MKKVMSLILTVALLLSIMPTSLFSVTASAATSGYYTYTVSNGKATIVDCESAVSGIVTVPASLGGYPVTEIGEEAFYNCTKMTNVTIPDSITNIGASAFKGCAELTSITLPVSITEIGENAFYNCKKLTAVNITDIVKWCNIYFATASANPLYYAQKLYLNNVLVTDIWLHYSASAISDYALYNCTSLNSINIPDSVQEIGAYAFGGCTGLTDVDLGEGVRVIGNWAFDKCTKLESVSMGSSVTSIGQFAFKSCSNLTSIDIPEKCNIIGTRAFEDCTNLSGIWVNNNNSTYSSDESGVLFDKSKTLLIRAPHKLGSRYSIPNSVTSIAECAFKKCSSLTGISIPNSVTQIGGAAFRDCTSLTSVNIPNSVTSIAEYAFERCSSLTGINIPNSVTQLGGYAFRDCKNLVGVTIPGSITRIDSFTFYNCERLTRLNISEGITEIDNYAFDGCKSLTTVTIPDSVSKIGDGAFGDCTSLTKAYNTYDTGKYIGNSSNPYVVLMEATSTSIQSCTIHEDTKVIYEGAFRDCTELMGIEIPAGVKHIGMCAFEGCINLTSVIISDSSVQIENDFGAFRDCEKLVYNVFDNGKYLGNSSNPYIFLMKATSTSIQSCTIHEDTKVIYEGAFSGCSGLTSITIPEGVTSISSRAFSRCSGLTSITIPEGVTSIDDSTFSDCSGLTSITIPEGVTSIDICAFSDCSGLTSITIPEGVTSISHHAFSGCSGLTSITIPESVTSIDLNAFKDCNSLNHVAYTGTESQWNSISIDKSNSALMKVTRHYETALQTKENCVAINVYCPVCQQNITSIAKQNSSHMFRAATCTAPKTCTVCGVTEGAALGHSYVLATCTTPKTCTVCGGTEGAALGHSYHTVVVEPTCTEKGSSTSTCTSCGDVVINILEAKGHSGDSWFDIVPLTCTTDGIKARICSTCGITETQVLTALGHTYSTVEIAPTCTEKGSVTKTCTTCGDVIIEEIAAKGHAWSAWIQTAMPSCTAEGSQIRFCNCGTRETAAIPKLPHSFENNGCTVCGKKSVELKITSVTLRPKATGLYFAGSFEIAEDVPVVRQGIVVSVYSGIPVADGTDPESLWSEGTTSVLVKNILCEEAQNISNQNRAEIPIYARAYVELADGTYIYSDVSTVNLQEVAEAADAQWDTLDDPQKEAFTAMYKKFQAILQAWNIPNVKKM